MTDEKVMNLIKSSADFYADYMYCSVIGNKASGLVAFNNVINELYDLKTGHLEGYMVEEEFAKKIPNYW